MILAPPQILTPSATTRQQIGAVFRFPDHWIIILSTRIEICDQAPKRLTNTAHISEVNRGHPLGVF